MTSLMRARSQSLKKLERTSLFSIAHLGESRATNRSLARAWSTAAAGQLPPPGCSSGWCAQVRGMVITAIYGSPFQRIIWYFLIPGERRQVNDPKSLTRIGRRLAFSFSRQLRIAIKVRRFAKASGIKNLSSPRITNQVLTGDCRRHVVPQHIKSYLCLRQSSSRQFHSAHVSLLFA